MQKLSALDSILKGFKFFITQPKLWILPLLTTLATFIAFLFVFTTIVWNLWPKEALPLLEWSFTLFKALGIGLLVLLLLWAFIFPIILNLAFEHLQRKVLGAENELSFFASMKLGISFTLKTLAPRFLWPLIVLLSVFIIPFLSPFLVQLAFGHIAVIDAFGLASGILGISAETILKELSVRRSDVWSASLIAGLGNFILTPTLIGWMFWIPSVYIGMALLLKGWISLTEDARS